MLQQGSVAQIFLNAFAISCETLLRTVQSYNFPSECILTYMEFQLDSAESTYCQIDNLPNSSRRDPRWE
ncbi:hypothetical protein KPH14_004590 [Odynerus spinipes]|uniref:Uncharacterized protein n=1 Tax=Odynerus spinipes TaxID=1348599 RepID=A0AAD9VPT5_9HYME|nr:hypothetical protein KPH14_004590 [Odynerus spinipes]